MGYQVIARKWRPQSFGEVVGQRHVTQTLENAIRGGRVAHAYIFSGVRGVGKTTTARILAKALNCVKGPTPEPCNACDSCKEIAAGTSFDVIEIDAASNRGIDQIRELREMVRYAPAASRHKVVILDEAHQLTDEASNALLKTVEEPPEKVIFVMATTQPDDLVETIRSRSQHFHFRALTFAEIVRALEEIAKKESLEVDSGALAVMSRAAEGSLRDALSLLEQAIAYCGTQIHDKEVRELLGVVPEEALDELMGAIAARSSERALGLVHKLISDGRNLQHFCREAIRHIRNLMVASVCGAESELIAAPPDERPRLARQAAQFGEEDLTRFFQILLSTDDDLRRKPDPRLHLELGLLKMVSAARLAPLEELLAELRGEPGATRAPAARATAASAAAPAREEPAPAPGSARRPAAMAPPSVMASTTEVSGLALAQVEAIKAAIQSRFRFLSSLIEPVTRWEVEGGEMRLYFPMESRALADMLQGREQMEQLRVITSQVLGQPLRVCVKLESARAARAAEPTLTELRAQFEQDPIVREMLRRFGGMISDVKRPDKD
jgi:DNA polymerase-3 subunit gamma/tau